MIPGQLTRPRVVVVSVQGRPGLPDDAQAALEQVADVRHLARPGAMTPEDAAWSLADADVVGLTPKVAPALTAELLARLPRLRGIVLYATGYDFVDAELLREHGITVSVLPDYSTVSVAEHALALLLSLSRRVHVGNDRSRGLRPADTSLRGFELAGRTLGVVGVGRIGSRIARLGEAFGMSVLGHDVRPRPLPPEVEPVSLTTLLQRSDAVVVACSLVHGAPALLGARELALLPAGAVLVNVSRAALVDGAAVVDAVAGGRLRGYAVDDAVFPGPGQDVEQVRAMLAEGRILQTGHSAWWSDEVLARGARLWAESLRRMAAGDPIDVVVHGRLCAGRSEALLAESAS